MKKNAALSLMGKLHNFQIKKQEIGIQTDGAVIKPDQEVTMHK